MPFFNFDELEKEYVTPKYSTAHGETVTGQNIEVARLSFNKDEGAVEHAHPHEQVMYVISGRLKVKFRDDNERPSSAREAPSMPFRTRSTR